MESLIPYHLTFKILRSSNVLEKNCSDGPTNYYFELVLLDNTNSFEVLNEDGSAIAVNAFVMFMMF